MGVISTGIHHINEELFLIAAQTIADNVKSDDLEKGSLYPPLKDIRECSIQIASRIAKYAYEKGKFIMLFVLVVFVLYFIYF